MTIPYATPATIAPYQETPDPPLYNGQRLTRAEFERRYHLMPHLKKAELLEGVVSVPSPLTCFHSAPHFDIVTWAGIYRFITPGVGGHDNITLRLLPDTEVQPDALLRLDEAVGGTSRITEDNYLAGPPELIIEVSASRNDPDMTIKRRVYERAGVQEYIVWQTYANQITWLALHQGSYRRVLPNKDGIIASRVFPGLHLHVPALLRGDTVTLQSTLHQAMQTDEYQAFVERMKQQL